MCYLVGNKGPSRLNTIFHIGEDRSGTAQTAEWYKNHGVEVILSTRIAKVDPETKTLFTQAGRTFTYKRLVAATGSR